MSAFSSFLCLKLYLLNFANAHAQKKIVMLIRIHYTCVALIYMKTVLSLEKSSGINFDFIKFVKNYKMSPFDKNK